MQYPLETKPDPPASTPVVEDHLSDLVGLGPASLDDLYNCGLRDDSDPLRVADLLRERNDDTIALKPCVRRSISNCYVDRFLDNALELLNDPSVTPGYFHAPYNLRGRQHGGACGIEGIKPAHHYPRALLDALADLRGDYVITNIGQSGCFSCGCAAIDVLRERLEADDKTVRGRVGFSAQSNPQRPIIRYASFDDEWLCTREFGQRIVSLFNSHDVPFDWNGDPDCTIRTYPGTDMTAEYGYDR